MNSLARAIIVCCVVLLSGLTARADDWPQWLGPTRDGVWRETGIVDKFPPGGPPVKWRVPIGAGYSSPTVAGGKVFLFDHVLDEGTSRPSNPFARIETPGKERVICFDAETGKQLWLHAYSCGYTMSYNAGPRGAPLVEGDSVYTLGGEGDLRCLRASDGWLNRQFQFNTVTPMWGFAASPLVEGDNLIVETNQKEGSVAAFDKHTMHLVWQALPVKEPGYSSPIVIDAGGTRQLIVWNAESLNSLDPKTGKVFWSEPFIAKQGMAIATPKRAGDLLFISSFYNGSMMVKLDPQRPAASVLWKIGGASERKTKSLHAVLCTPVIDDGYIYGVCSYGQLRCLKAQTGERIWETFAATSADAGEVRWSNAFIVKNANRYFLFNEHGELIIARLSPKGYEEISRARVIEPTNLDPGRPVVWSQPAFANKCVYVRNDKELVCLSLAAEGT